MAKKIKKSKTLFSKALDMVQIPIRRQQRPIQDKVRERTAELKATQAQMFNERAEYAQHTKKLKTALVKKREEVAKKEVQVTGFTQQVRRLASIISAADPKYHMRIPPFYQDMTYSGMYRAVQLSPEVSGMHRKLEEEILRRGNKWVPKFTSKCPKCGKEWQGEEPLDRCPICDPPADDFFDALLELLEQENLTGDSITALMADIANNEDTITVMEVPNEMEHVLADRLLDKVNECGQNIDDLDKEMEADINTADSCFYILKYQYNKITPEGVAKTKTLQEVYRGNPILMRKVIDGFNNVGGIYWRCLVHSDSQGITEKRMYDNEGFPIADFTPPNCDLCGRPMHEVRYVQLAFETTTPEHIRYTSYFIDGEVIEGHFYKPNTAFGGPPMISLFIPVATLIHLHVYVYDTFRDRKLPMSLIWSVSANPQEAVDRWDKVQERLAQDSTYVPHYVIEPEMTGGAGKMGVIQGMPSLNEIQYVDYMEVLRKIIGNFYGVFYGSYARSSNQPGASEGPDMQVDPKTIEMKHKFWDRMHSNLVESMGVKTWDYIKVPPEDRDVMKKLQISQLEWQIAQQAQQVGFETIRNHVGKLVQRKGPLTDVDIARLMEVVKAVIGAEAQQKAMEEQQNGADSDVTFDPDTENTPTGDRKKKDTLAKGPEGTGESAPRSMSGGDDQGGRTQKRSLTTAATNPGGTSEPSTDAKGAEQGSKQAVGGADRSRPTDGQNTGEMGEQLANIKSLVVMLLMLIRARQMPKQALITDEKREREQ